MRLEADVSVRRPGGFAVDVAFAVETEALAIVGPSGSGKTTLLEVLAGVQRGGRVLIDGLDVSRIPLHRRRVGHVTQDALLFPHLDVAANLLYGPRATLRDDVLGALAIGHLLERRPRNLSGGERRRVALARALLSEPDLLLLDEPFAGLDGTLRRDALSLLHRIRRRFGVPLVLVSHVTEEVVGLADHALRLEDGRLVAEGPAPAVLRAGETHVDNHLMARVIGHTRVVCDDIELEVSLPEGARGDVRLACWAHDVLLASERPVGLSARNVFETTVEALVPAGEVVLVRLARPPLVATLMPDAVAELQLAPGAPVWVLLKATALTCLGVDAPDALPPAGATPERGPGPPT